MTVGYILSSSYFRKEHLKYEKEVLGRINKLQIIY